MNLLIRSQNRLSLVKVNNNITIEHSLRPGATGYQMYVGITKIGEYETEERAKEILTDIQGIICLKDMYINDKQEVLKSWEKFSKEQIHKVRKAIVVYEMPKE